MTIDNASLATESQSPNNIQPKCKMGAVFQLIVVAVFSFAHTMTHRGEL